jgi:hypothetical protein
VHNCPNALAASAICCATVEWDLSIGSPPDEVRSTVSNAKKKPAWWNTPEVFDHAGLLVNEPPAAGELPFI